MQNKIFQVILIATILTPSLSLAENTAPCNDGYYCNPAPNNALCAGNNWPEPCCGGLTSCLTKETVPGCCAPNSSSPFKKN